jgi:phosphatidylserine/phosphatidylglycerophosphate/cardiolipin synthase-like enzyme
LVVRSHARLANHGPLLVAFMPDGQASNDDDEAFAIQNIGEEAITLAGWMITDGEATAVLPKLQLPPAAIVWCGRQASAFRRYWVASPGCEYETDTDPDVPNASGGVPRLANSGDELQLLAPDGAVMDAVVFGDGLTTSAGWHGPALAYYQGNPRFAHGGQVFYRLFDPTTLLPLADTDAAADWAQGNPDPGRGRRAAYPGWNLYTLSTPLHVLWPDAHPLAQVAVAPDNIYIAVRDLFAAAQTSIHIETYDLDHPELARLLAERAGAGVDVRVLLEGAPVGGLTDATRWASQQIAAGGGHVAFMVNDVGDANDRYAYVHAKMAIVDGRTLLVSSENLGPDSMPADAGDGETWGRRGFAVLIEDAALAARAESILSGDADQRFLDVFSWQPGHPVYGPPAPGYSPPDATNRAGYIVRYPAVLRPYDITEAFLFTAPEASLTPGPLLDLIARAGPGDTIFTAQLYEQTFWGAASSDPARDPNPRLEALIGAARRGTRVRILLDNFFDQPSDPRSNLATAVYVNTIARAEGLDLAARLGNPSGAGLHGKLHLLALGGERWVVTGSLNGGEVSAKLNREVALAMQSPAAYELLQEVFQTDWQTPAPEP